MSNRRADHCPLCHASTIVYFHTDQRRSYYRCTTCDLIHVPAEYHLPADQERQRYDSHRNSPTDSGYRNFLSRLLTPLLPRLPAGASGLDFGCGPGPTLSVMLQEYGFSMAVYDPFYADDECVLQRRYDFVTCTEAIEHFARPDVEWQRLLELLNEDGRLAIMTRFHDKQVDFADWYYKNDPTHIGFYSVATFAWLAQRDGLMVEFFGDSVAIFSPLSAMSFE
jgi:hypothetical protein